MTKEEIKLYFNNTPNRYDKRAYDAFLAEFGIPKLPKAIHITGTNGKGSTAYYLALSLQKSGYKVGLFTSPYFKYVNELASINGKMISDAEISNYIKEYDEAFKKYELSLFEIMTFISFKYFVKNKVDYAIIEVGMGGLLDATNIFTPILSIITNIGLDHIEALGPSIVDIAEHKAGIIKKGVPVLFGDTTRRAEKVILDAALKLDAPVYRPSSEVIITNQTLDNISFSYNDKIYTLRSGARYEVINALTVLKAIEILNSEGANISEEALVSAFDVKTLEGRFTVMQKDPIIVVDGSHNPHAIRVLLNDIKNYDKQLKVIFATFSDKDYLQELDLFALAGAEITLTTFDHVRAVKNFSHNKLAFKRDHRVAIRDAIHSLVKNDMLLIVGSLYFARLVISEFKKGIYA